MLRALLLVLCLSCGVAQAEVANDEARFTKLAEHLRCLVCQNQSIAESQAELAMDLKGQVREMMQAGKTDPEIIDYMVQRYGDFVLYDPPFKLVTVLLWAGPASLLLLALGGFAWTVRRRSAASAGQTLSAQEQAAARALLGEAEQQKENTR